jgi:hypothetical protein
MLKTFTLVHLLLLLLTGLVPAMARAELRLNEFLAGPARDWDGSGAISTRDDEWVEVWNEGPGSLDLTGYFITDGDTIPRFGLSGSLVSQGRVLVFGSQAVEWERANGFPVFGLSLGNTGDKVLLWHAVSGDTTLVDQYVYLAHEAATDRGVGRGGDGGAWRLLDGLNPYSGTTPPLGSGCLPTPGTPNSCSPTPVLKASWGRLKTLYR